MHEQKTHTICHFTCVHKWNDIRIYKKMCVSLAKQGHKVILIAPGAEEGTHEGVEVISVKKIKGSRLKRMLNTAKSTYEKVLKIDADVYHFHDPELLRFGKKLVSQGKKVIYDSHEDVPQDILDKSYLGPVFIRKLISRTYNWYEKKTSKKLSGVISVSDPITSKFKVKNKISVHNYPLVAKFIELSNENKSFPVKINYSGGLTRIRGIKEMIDALALMKEDASMTIAGRWESDAYFEECKQSEGWSKVDFLGMISLEENYEKMSECHIGIVNFLPVGNHLNALPNKAFEYFAAGLVVQMSNLDFWLKEFGEFAFYHEPTSPRSIAESLDELILNKVELNQLGEKGKKFVIENRSWESQADLLSTFYQKIIQT